MKTIIVLTTQLLLWCSAALAQTWTRIENLPATEFTMVKSIDGTVYASSGHTLYYSTNEGVTWQNTIFTDAATEVRSIVKFNTRLYLGTDNGIYSAPLAQINGAWTKNLNSGEVSSFAQRDNELFASTIGGGVYRRTLNGTWVNFSNGLPSYSMSVQKIIDTPDGLIAIAGANGTFYRFINEANQWFENYYDSEGYQPGLDFEDAERIGNTIYVSRRNQVLRSDNFGYHWILDNTGLPNGLNRSLAMATDELYVLTTVFTGDDNLTLLRKRALNAPGTDWSPGAQILNFFSYDLAQMGDKTFIASNLGLYVNDASLGTVWPIASEKVARIFPNPSADGRFTLQNADPIESVTVYDAAGKTILNRENVPACFEFEVNTPGFYLVKMVCGQDAQTFKIIAQ